MDRKKGLLGMNHQGYFLGWGAGGREKQNGRKASRFYDSSGVVFEVHCSQLDVLSEVVDLLGMGLREITGKEKVP